ncbi:glycerol acyltransferase [Candidatus Magnetomorum sp. HK-1]|nr:glycerol acyltransferase [Candidatus Magnetomorum sp. HK-1]
MIRKGLTTVANTVGKSLSLIKTGERRMREELVRSTDLMHIVLKKILVSDEIEALVERMPKKLGDHGYDPWGYHPDTAKLGLSVLKKIYDYYFRVETYGLENIPKTGSAFVIANHSGQLPLDGTLIGTAMATNPHGPRAPRVMIERFFPTVPFVYTFLTEVGAIIGDPINCIKMLENDEIIIVFPEGIRGSGKPYKLRYQLQYMGTGFVRIAIQTKSPIVPVGVVGCEETMPSMGSIDPLARLLSIPYVPIAPPFPLPAKVILNFGKPMYLDGDIDDENEMIKKVELVKDEINNLIQQGLQQRGKRFF